jgi:hypothetical protein
MFLKQANNLLGNCKRGSGIVFEVDNVDRVEWDNELVAVRR